MESSSTSFSHNVKYRKTKECESAQRMRTFSDALRTKQFPWCFCLFNWCSDLCAK